MKTVVIDLDGTLCDSAHRNHHACNGEWDAFHSLCSQDEPHSDVLWLVRLLAGHSSEAVEVIGCTGRNERYRSVTEAWLMRHQVMLDAVLMRPDYDFQPDHKLKIELITDWHNATEPAANRTVQERVAFVLDDRDKVVEAWRDAGFNCWQVRLGSF